MTQINLTPAEIKRIAEAAGFALNMGGAYAFGDWDSVKNDEECGMTDGTDDGWGKDVQDSLHEVFDKLDKLMYEVRNCVRGGYTRCANETELGDYIRTLASDLEAAADRVG